MIIKTHKELAQHIQGEKILHMCSLGKDSIVCLDWLVKFAKVEVVSVFFKRLAHHPDDERYLNYLKAQYPSVLFLTEYNGHELNDFLDGRYQTPIERLNWTKHQQYNGLSMAQQAKEIAKKYGCKYVCKGNSKYESFARAKKFHQKGLVQDESIYPIGMMTKAQVMHVIRNFGIKLHPQYKTNETTIDYPSYYKMRSAMIVNPDYARRIYDLYPLLKLDRYRYEVLFK